MYAIVKTGGKQYKVENGMVFNTEMVEAQIGDTVKLEALMLVDGEKVLAGSDAGKVIVEAQVIEHGKDKKITIFTYKAKKNVRHRQGHRQPYTKLKITNITAD